MEFVPRLTQPFVIDPRRSEEVAMSRWTTRSVRGESIVVDLLALGFLGKEQHPDIRNFVCTLR